MDVALCAPTLNQYVLLARMLHTAADEGITDVFIIDNGRQLDHTQWPNQIHPWVYTPSTNLGVSGSWNWFISKLYRYEWLLIANDDVEFCPGDIGRIMDYAERNRECWLFTTNVGWSVYLIDPRRAVEDVGFFDENFWPAYHEDCDYSYRMSLQRCVALSVPETQIYTDGSQTHRSGVIPRFWEKFTRTQKYYRRKWGGLPGEEQYTSPFNGDDGAEARAVAEVQLNRA